MFLSRVQIDTDNRRKIRELTHLGAYHSWVEDSFPDELASSVRTRKLWRIDRLYDKEYLLIVSSSQPDLYRLEKYGVEHSAETKDYDPFLKQIHNGGTYQFRTTLNPTHSVSQGEGMRGRVFPETTVEHQMDYLRRKSECNGFVLPDGAYQITERGYSVVKKVGEKPLRLCRVTYEGRLVVTDSDLFRKALTGGIGRKKAYGFGLMTVIPENER